MKTPEEFAIVANAYNSYCYARYILKGRFELGEAVIATDPVYSYWYSVDVIKDRFLLGERDILSSPDIAPSYIIVHKGKFTDEELILLKLRYPNI